jgi:hypothetical protein
VTVAYPASHQLQAGDKQQQQQEQQQQPQQPGTRVLCVPDTTLLVASRGALEMAQLGQALATGRAGAEGVSRFVHLSLTASYREALVHSQDPAV